MTECEDAISREEAIDVCNQSVNILEATDRIKDLPSVYPKAKEPKWIPVSERLPEIGQYVLCSLINAKDVKHRIIICEYKQEIWWSYVIAWMPLPEPYKAESEEK